MVLRKCFKWLGVALLTTVMVFVFDTAEIAIYPNTSQFQFLCSYAALPSGALFIEVGYCLYRPVRALAPVGKIQDDP